VVTAISVVGYKRGKPRQRWISDKHGKQSMKGKTQKWRNKSFHLQKTMHIRRQNIKQRIKKLRI